jgi:hypothetical protein
MLRLSGAFITVISCVTAGFSYFLLFQDEFDPNNPVNVGAGFFAPMYRRWVEYPLVIWTIFLVAIVGYCLLIGGRQRIVVNWSVAHQWWFRLHLASGIVILVGLMSALIAGQQFHWRDIVSVALGMGFLALATFDRLTRQVKFDYLQTHTFDLHR